MVRPEGIEPPACGLGNRRSILLSYGRMVNTVLYLIIKSSSFEELEQTLLIIK